jgi:hypothetical protein
MKLVKEEQLFFGCKIDSKLREGLSQAKPGDRRYFEDPNSEFLRVCVVEEEKWIGKIMKGGIPAGDVEDIQRNVVSILRRVCPDTRISASSIKIFAVVPNDEPVAVEPEKEQGGGPYIDY